MIDIPFVCGLSLGFSVCGVIVMFALIVRGK